MNLKMNRFIETKWGGYETIRKGYNYAVKELHIFPRCTLSYQRHSGRAEQWIVAYGALSMLHEGVDMILGPQSQMYIPKMSWHAAFNTGEKPVKVIEIWIGDHLSEDDIERKSYPELSWLGKSRWKYGHNPVNPARESQASPLSRRPWE